MNTDKMREEFEVWAAKHKHNLNRDGVVVGYACRYTDLAWNSWQASREVVEVELPGRFFTGHGGEVCWIRDEKESRYFDSYDDISYSLTVEAIESLGLKVKP